MTRSSAQIVALVTHARSVPARDRAAFGARLRAVRDGDAIRIETCHRVEAYLATADDPARIADEVGLPAAGRVLVGRDAIGHAVAVAVGSDSVVVGDDQVLHQLRGAVASARADGRLHADLERLFGLALRAGRRARSWRQGPPPSLADLALEVIQGRTGPLDGRAMLIVGAGAMARLAASAAGRAGANVWIANRSSDRARALAAAVHGRDVGFDPGERTGTVAGVIVAIGGPWNIGATTVEALVAGGAVVVDLSVPPAIPSHACAALGARLVSADDLAIAEADAGTVASPSDRRVGELIERTVSEYLDWLGARDGRSAAEALVHRADLEREAELEQLWRRHPELQPELRDAIERMTESFARRLLREPLERLGHDTDGRTERAARDLFAV